MGNNEKKYWQLNEKRMDLFLYFMVGILPIAGIIVVAKIWHLMSRLATSGTNLSVAMFDFKMRLKACEKKLEKLEKCYENQICKLENTPDPVEDIYYPKVKPYRIAKD